MNIDEAKSRKREFCQKLKKAREYQGYDLEEVSEKSKISIIYLENLENNNWSFLPRPYIRSFIRTYTQILGMNVPEVLAEYDQIVTALTGEKKKSLVADYSESEKYNRHKTKSGRMSFDKQFSDSPLNKVIDAVFGLLANMSSNLLLGILGGVVVIVIFVIALNMWKSTEKEPVEEIAFNQVVEEHQDIVKKEEPPVVSTEPEKKIEEKPDSTFVQKVESEPEPEPEPVLVTSVTEQEQVEPVSRKLVLETIAVDTCYMRVYTDSDTTIIADLVLTRDESRIFEADSSFLVILGSAADMKLILNNKDLGFYGPSGKVVSLDINKEGAKRIRRPLWTMPPKN